MLLLSRSEPNLQADNQGTVAGKCNAHLQSLRQIYISENIFTYHKTTLHYQNTFTSPETNLHFRKQMNKTQNTFTSAETNLQVKKKHLQLPKHIYIEKNNRKGNVPKTKNPEVRNESWHI